MRVDNTVLYHLKRQIVDLKREQFEIVLNNFISGKESSLSELVLNNPENKKPAPIIFSTIKTNINNTRQEDQLNEQTNKVTPNKPK